MKQRFLVEARTLVKFSHPNIAQVYTFFEENNTAYLVMEFVRGENLLSLVSRGPIREAEALKWIEQAADALHTMHQANLLHRDIKPENLMLNDDGRVVLIDFGTARAYAAGKTSHMSVMLTQGYAPWEQYITQGKFGPYTDIYALAATLYHLLTGVPPVPAPDRKNGVILNSPRRLNKKVSQSVSDAVVWAMEMEAVDRPQSVPEFLQALRGGRASSPQPPAGPTPPGPGAGAPLLVLELPPRPFNFPNMQKGSIASGSFVIKNSGGGMLQGSIKSDQPWLRVARSQFDPRRHNQKTDADFLVDSSGLPLGYKSTGTIEVQSNGGNQYVTINISLELPDKALKRFRRPVLWFCLGAGALFGYVFQVLLGVGSSRDAVGTIAGLLSIIMITAWGGKRAGWGGALGGFLLSMMLLGALQRASPAVFSAVTWAAVFSSLASFSAPWLFARMQGRIMPASLFVMASGGVLATCMAVGGWILRAPRGKAARPSGASAPAAAAQPASPPGPGGLGPTPSTRSATDTSSQTGTTPPSNQQSLAIPPQSSYGPGGLSTGTSGASAGGNPGPGGLGPTPSTRSATDTSSQTGTTPPSNQQSLAIPPQSSYGPGGLSTGTPGAGAATSDSQLRAQPSIPSSGTVVWSGHLEKNGMITIVGESASSGSLEGELPGVPVMIQVYPTNIGVADFPSPQNGWKKVVLRGSKRQDVVVRIEWKTLQQ